MKYGFLKKDTDGKYSHEDVVEILKYFSIGILVMAICYKIGYIFGRIKR